MHRKIDVIISDLFNGSKHNVDRLEKNRCGFDYSLLIDLEVCAPAPLIFLRPSTNDRMSPAICHLGAHLPIRLDRKHEDHKGS